MIVNEVKKSIDVRKMAVLYQLSYIFDEGTQLVTPTKFRL